MTNAAKTQSPEKWWHVLGAIYLENPKCNAVEYQSRLNERMGSKAVGLSAVQKRMPKIKEQYKQLVDSGFLRPWNIGRMVNFPVPETSVPLILAAQRLLAVSESKSLNTSQALWIGRLHSFTYSNGRLDELEWLLLWATRYSDAELHSLIGQYEFDTSELDRQLSASLGGSGI